MDFVFVIQLIKAVIRELWRYRYGALLLGGLVSLAILAYGMLWNEKYSVTATLYADQQNIIAPLLRGQAQVTEVEEQIQLVKDLILSERLLEKVILGTDFLEDSDDPAQLAAVTSGLRKKIDVRRLGRSYISVSYADINADRAYYVVTNLVDLFIKESSSNKRSESKQAFLFIDKQASSYKDLLRQAEERLKQFNAENLDGDGDSVQSSIESLRERIADIELDLSQSSERVQSLQQQVSQEDRYLSRKAKSEEYRERIASSVAQLDNMLLSFTENHPDVISLREHIKALRKAAANASGGESNIVGVENPVYDELRAALATAKVDRDALQKRLKAMQSRLQEERVRAQRIAEKNAELAELTRDYDVTKGLYEDLLERKEKARLSMTLDIEGQGVTYKIQEPAKYPLLPSGLRFIHFAILGCMAAVILPIGLAVAYIVVDPRIRFANHLEDELGVPLLAEVPHLISNPIQRLRKFDAQVFILLALGCALSYCAATVIFIIWS